MTFETLERYDSYLFHRNVARAQRNAYNKHRTAEHLKDKILIELDYKQKIKIGMSPRQIRSEYFDQQDRIALVSIFFVL